VIEIRIHADTGAEARQKLSDLLGVSVAPAPSEKFPTKPVETTEPTQEADVSDASDVAELEAKEEPKKGRGRPAKAKAAEPAETVQRAEEALSKAEPEAVAQQISTGESRVSPEDTQDDADEAAETEANRDAVAPLTHDDVRQSMSEYMAKFGMPAVQEDGPQIIAVALGPVPAGAKNGKGEPITKWALSAIPAEQDALNKVVSAFSEALEKNPFKRDAV
jgi:hypothetical protein